MPNLTLPLHCNAVVLDIALPYFCCCCWQQLIVTCNNNKPHMSESCPLWLPLAAWQSCCQVKPVEFPLTLTLYHCSHTCCLDLLCHSCCHQQLCCFGAAVIVTITIRNGAAWELLLPSLSPSLLPLAGCCLVLVVHCCCLAIFIDLVAVAHACSRSHSCCCIAIAVACCCCSARPGIVIVMV